MARSWHKVQLLRLDFLLQLSCILQQMTQLSLCDFQKWRSKVGMLAKVWALQRDVGPVDVCRMMIFGNDVKLIMNWQLRNVNQSVNQLNNPFIQQDCCSPHLCLRVATKTASVCKASPKTCLCFRSFDVCHPLLRILRWHSIPSPKYPRPRVLYPYAPETRTRNPALNSVWKGRVISKASWRLRSQTNLSTTSRDSATKDLETKTDTKQLQQGSWHKHGQTFKLWVRGFRAVGMKLHYSEWTETFLNFQIPAIWSPFQWGSSYPRDSFQ